MTPECQDRVVLQEEELVFVKRPVRAGRCQGALQRPGIAIPDPAQPSRAERASVGRDGARVHAWRARLLHALHVVHDTSRGCTRDRGSDGPPSSSGGGWSRCRGTAHAFRMNSGAGGQLRITELGSLIRASISAGPTDLLPVTRQRTRTRVALAPPSAGSVSRPRGRRIPLRNAREAGSAALFGTGVRARPAPRAARAASRRETDVPFE